MSFEKGNKIMSFCRKKDKVCQKNQKIIRGDAYKLGQTLIANCGIPLWLNLPEPLLQR